MIVNVNGNYSQSFKGVKPPSEFKDPIMKDVYNLAVDKFGLKNVAKHFDLTVKEIPEFKEQMTLGLHAGPIKYTKKQEQLFNDEVHKYKVLSNFSQKRYNLFFYAEQLVELAKKMGEEFLANKTIIKPIKGNPAGTKVVFKFDANGQQISKEYKRKKLH